MQTQRHRPRSTPARKGSRSIVTRSALSFRGSHRVMTPSLLELMEELLQSIEQRDAGDPDAPAWEASARIERLEEELARRLAEAGAGRGAVAVTSVEARRSEGALAGIA